MLLIGKCDCFVHTVIIVDLGQVSIKNGQFAHCPLVYDPITQAPYLTSAYPYSSDRSRHKPQHSSSVTNDGQLLSSYSSSTQKCLPSLLLRNIVFNTPPEQRMGLDYQFLDDNL